MEKNLTKSNISSIIKEIFIAILILLIPSIMVIFLFYNHDFYPFNENGLTMLMIDAQSEYVAYFRYLKAILVNDQSLAYTLGKAFGGNFMSIYAFYLASPLNLLVAFVNDKDIPGFMLIIGIVKMILSSVSMYLLLRFKTGHAKIGYLMFACGYGLCAYSFMYLSNLMWLDGVMILPLVVLGLERLTENKTRWLYPLALMYALICSWYIGAFICLFSVLFMAFKVISSYGEYKKVLHLKSDKFPWQKLVGRFITYSLIGGLLSSPVWLSAFIHFGGTKASGFSFSYSPFSFDTLAMLLQGFFENSYSASEIKIYDGYANMFTSISLLAFVVLYFFNRHYSKQERFSALGLLLIYLLAVLNYGLYVIMHGGKPPTWFPTRFSFIISFLVCYFGGKQYDQMDKTRLSDYLAPLSLTVIALIVIFNQPINDKGEMYDFSLISFALFALTLLLLFINSLITNKSNSKAKFVTPVITIAITALSLISTYRGDDNILKSNIESNEYQKYQTYLKDDEFQTVVDEVKALDANNAYRMENTFNRPGNYNQIDNDPLFYDYNGISHFSSCELADVMSYMGKLGFHDNGFFEGYDGGSTLAANSFLGIRYLIDDKDDYSVNKPHFLTSIEDITSQLNSENLKMSYRDISVYENQFALPLGFSVLSNSATFIGDGYYIGDNIYWYDHFEYQNSLYRAITNQVNADIFSPLDYDISYSSGVEDVTSSHQEYLHPGERYYNLKPNAQITITFEVPEEVYSLGEDEYNLYFALKDMYNDVLQIRMDGRNYEMTSYWHRGIRSFEDNSRHYHTLILRNKSGYELTNFRVQPEIYYENVDVLRKYAESINQSSLFDASFSYQLQSLTLSGKFNKVEGLNEFLFTLPYENGMQIYIDGKKVNTYIRFNIFSACDISSLDEGEHMVKIVYTEKGIIYGSLFASLALELLLALYLSPLFAYKKRQFPLDEVRIYK